jgi:hypothetical protein
MRMMRMMMRRRRRKKKKKKKKKKKRDATYQLLTTASLQLHAILHFLATLQSCSPSFPPSISHLLLR